MKPLVLTVTLLLPLVLGLTMQDDDIVFDDVGEEASSIAPVVHRKEHETPKHRVETFWGVPNATVTVGHVLKLRIPEQAFGGKVDHYEVSKKNGRPLPYWIYWDDAASTFLGVPTKKDVGQHHVTVRAHGKHGDVAIDSFTVRVKPEKFDELKYKDGKTHCDESEEQTLFTIILDAKFDDLKPITKVKAIENLAKFLSMHTNSFSMHSQSSKEGAGSQENIESIILPVHGNVKHRKEKHPTYIQWQAGCESSSWKHQADQLKQLREQARNGTLAEVLQIPILMGRVKTDASALLRNRRGTSETGSGDYGDDEYGDEYDDYAEGEYGEEGEDTITDPPPQASGPNTSTSKDDEKEESEHPHRHHHGEETLHEVFDEKEITSIMNRSLMNGSELNASSTTPMNVPSTEITEQPTTTGQSTTTTIPSTTIVPTTSTQASTVVRTTTTTPVPETTPVVTTVTIQPTTTSSTTTTTSTTEIPRTIPPIITTEKIVYRVPNSPPTKGKRLKKIGVTAGKILSYIIPADTFNDTEDGDTRNLKLSLYLQGSPVKATHWLQLNSATQEIYGLPLEKDVSKWDHVLVVSDSEGLNVTESLDIHVQQHKHSRSVNHEFSIYLKFEKRSVFPTNVDWEMKVVRSLAQLYGDSDANQITVRSINITQDQAIFTWTNDSIPRRSECPKHEIDKLLDVLTNGKGEEPNGKLIDALAPEIRVKRVVYQGIGQCEAMEKPEMPKVSTEGPNKWPIVRNQVDRINATVGQLVIYRVPDDTFYDPDEGPTSRLKLTLLGKDRTPIPSNNWLQFDTKNQEFYGVPLHEDIGRKEYQLVATDKEGLSTTDVMSVIVERAPSMRHNVEFSMNLAIPYESFAHSAMQKKIFIERVRDLFEDKDTSAISLDRITEGNNVTVVTWRNTTLPTEHCPNDKIEKLRKVLVKPDKSFTDRIEDVMGKEFPVEQITLTPMGMCLGQFTGVHSLDSVPPASGDSKPLGTSNDDYLITFVLPGIIIAAMILLAGIIACVLYRRRRSGKMSLSQQDDERQSFRSKGIPVIFQDELDEKPDPGNKSPVILKEEKPPLPPPEYQKAEDGADVPMLSNETSEEPYQPPPPFATNRDNNRQNRPKPTPTYRKPPPYVPP